MLLNLDAGEQEDEPEELWALADILAVACGGHAGDAPSMRRLAAFCAASVSRSGQAARRPGLGAHPSYPDREGFGRRSLTIEPRTLASVIEAQCAMLALEARDAGATVRWVKPHGALYHDASRDRALADAILDGAVAALGSSFDVLDEVRQAFRDDDDPAPDDPRAASTATSSVRNATHARLTVIGPPTGALFEAARDRGLAYLREGFADRGVRVDGSLIPRGEPGALITDPAVAAARARELVTQVDTICVHADTPDALVVARAVRKALDG